MRMNFLLLMVEDCAGVGIRLKQAIDAHPDHSARAICMRPNALGYPVDMVKPSASDTDRVHGWADAFVIYDAWPRNILKHGKPMACIYNGTIYRSRWDRFNQEDAENGIVSFGTTIDLCHHGIGWLPAPMAPMDQKPKTEGAFHVCHSPSNRRRKGTPAIEAALSDLEGVWLDVVAGASNSEVLSRKAPAHLYAGQFLVGYGVSALEAWVLNMPVTSGVQPLTPGALAKKPPSREEIIAQFDEKAGGLPFYEVTPETLRDAVEAFMSDEDLYDHWLKRGVDFVQEFHSPEAVVERLLGGMGL
jgi:hypothetical protein